MFAINVNRTVHTVLGQLKLLMMSLLIILRSVDMLGPPDSDFVFMIHALQTADGDDEMQFICGCWLPMLTI